MLGKLFDTILTIFTFRRSLVQTFCCRIIHGHPKKECFFHQLDISIFFNVNFGDSISFINISLKPASTISKINIEPHLAKLEQNSIVFDISQKNHHSMFDSAAWYCAGLFLWDDDDNKCIKNCVRSDIQT